MSYQQLGEQFSYCGSKYLCCCWRNGLTTRCFPTVSDLGNYLSVLRPTNEDLPVGPCIQ